MIITVRNLKASVQLGCYDWEKGKKRPVLINMAITFDGKKAADSDSISDTIDYDAMCSRITELVEARHYNLIESMVSDVLDLLGSYKIVTEASVEIAKPGAVSAAEQVSISDSRSYG